MSSGRDSKSYSTTSDDAIRVVLTEGQTNILPDASRIEKITNNRAALSSYQADRNKKPKSLTAPIEQTAAGNMPAAHDNKDIAQAEDNPDMKLTTTSTTRLKKTPVPTVILSVPTWWVKFYDIPGIDQLPNVLQYLCLAYADYLPEEKMIYQYPDPTTINKAPFFTRYISQIQYRLEQAANDFLREGNIDKALALIEQNDKVINIETQGTDRFGRCIKGRSLLQMAAMGGDVNLREKKAKEKKDHGALELFIKAAKLTKDEVAAQAKCQSEIDKLRNDLIRIVSNEVITCGYILDTHIYDAFGNWFTDNS